MTYTITRENGVSDAMAVQEAINLCAANGAGESVLANLLRDLRDSIEEQVKPAIDEPQEFTSVVRATSHGEPMLWQKTPMHGKHYWESETGAVEVWSELTDVEVLRVGLGEAPDNESYRKGFEFGMREMNTQIHLRHLEQLAESITSERKNALEKAIQTVEELAP